MMEKIYSSVKPDVLLHVLYRSDTSQGEREDLSPKAEFLQVSAVTLAAGREVRAHCHLENRRESWITQEFMVVVHGRVEACYYDLDRKVVRTLVLSAGDCSVTFRGGHSFKCIEDARVFEVKNGPYLGREKDRADY